MSALPSNWRSNPFLSTTHVLPFPAAPQWHAHAAQWHAHGDMWLGALPAAPFCGDVPAHAGACCRSDIPNVGLPLADAWCADSRCI